MWTLELKALLSEDLVGAMFGHAEDPVEHLFTHEFTFDGGGHIVFPGITAGAPLFLSNLCKALFFHPTGFPDRPFQSWARRFIPYEPVSLLRDRANHNAFIMRKLRPILGPLYAVPRSPPSPTGGALDPPEDTGLPGRPPRLLRR